MFFNVAATKVRQKGVRAKIVRGDSFVELLPDGRTVASSGLNEEAMTANDWEIIELD